MGRRRWCGAARSDNRQASGRKRPPAFNDKGQDGVRATSARPRRLLRSAAPRQPPSATRPVPAASHNPPPSIKYTSTSNGNSYQHISPAPIVAATRPPSRTCHRPPSPLPRHHLVIPSSALARAGRPAPPAHSATPPATFQLSAPHTAPGGLAPAKPSLDTPSRRLAAAPPPHRAASPSHRHRIASPRRLASPHHHIASPRHPSRASPVPTPLTSPPFPAAV